MIISSSTLFSGRRCGRILPAVLFFLFFAGERALAQEPIQHDRNFAPSLLSSENPALEEVKAKGEEMPFPNIPGLAKVFLVPGGPPPLTSSMLRSFYSYLQTLPHLHTVLLIARAERKVASAAVVYTASPIPGLSSGSSVANNPLVTQILLRSSLVQQEEEVCRIDPSLHLHVTYLSQMLPKVRCVPVLLDPRSEEEECRIAAILARVLSSDGCVLLAISHLAKSPRWGGKRERFPLATPDWVRKIDQEIFQTLATIDPLQLKEKERFLVDCYGPRLSTVFESPGVVSIAVRIAQLLTLDTTTLLAEEAKENPNDRSVVGFATLAWSAKGQTLSPSSAGRTDDASLWVSITQPLSPAAQTELLKRAREAVEAAIAGARYEASPPLALELRQSWPVFVTLFEGKRKRSSRGILDRRLPLYEAVVAMSGAAAVEDPYHADPPLTLTEGRRIGIEISIIRAIEPLGDWSESTFPQSGILVERGNRRGILLPAPGEQREFSKEEAFRAACRQAGLEENAFRDGSADLYELRIERITDLGR